MNFFHKDYQLKEPKNFLFWSCHGNPVYKNLTDIAKGVIFSIENREWVEEDDIEPNTSYIWKIKHSNGSKITLRCSKGYATEWIRMSGFCDSNIHGLTENDKSAIEVILLRNSFGWLKQKVDECEAETKKIEGYRTDSVARAEAFKQQGRLLVLKNEIK